jgi:uncharacterized protein YndB with AHSA1/START domain
MTRAFDASRELVCEAWTKPEHVRHWRGRRWSTARGTHITPLAPGVKAHRLAIKSSDISGRRIRRLVSEQFLG